MSENKDTDKVLDIEGKRLKDEINNDDLYNALMAGLNKEQQMQILRGIQSYLNHSNEQEMSSKLIILEELTKIPQSEFKAYFATLDKLPPCLPTPGTRRN